MTEARKYRAYAQECIRQAQAEPSVERRERLIELARVWMQAALREQQLRPAGLSELHEEQRQDAA
jgi:hypothetical protein